MERYESLQGREGAWMVGSIIRSQEMPSVRPLGDRFHLNGNALYHMGSAAFRQFVSAVQFDESDLKPYQVVLTSLLRSTAKERLGHRFIYPARTF